MSWTPFSAAARRIVWSSSTSISMPTGSNRTMCFSPIAASLERMRVGPGRERAGGGSAGPHPSPDPRSGVRRCRPTSRALLPVVLDEGGAASVVHLVEQHVRAAQRRATAHVVQRPHLLGVQVEVGLSRHGVAVVAHEAHVGDDIGPVPAVVQRLPLAVTDQLAHVRGLATLVGGPEGLDVGPAAHLVAVGAVHAVDLGGDDVLTDQTRDHAGPAAGRVHVVDVFEDDRVVAVGHGEAVVVLPPLAVLVVPARVLVLEPLEVLVGHAVDAPVVGEPTGGEELRDLVDVALLPDLLPRLLDQVVRDDQAVLLQRDEVGTVVVVVDPTTPHLRVGLPVLAAVLRAVLDERA